MTGTSTAPVRVLGPAAWNTMIRLGHLPEPRSQMVVAEQTWDTVGGTSAGKALHLRDLGLAVHLMTTLGEDAYGDLVRGVLPPFQIDVLPTEATEHHVNIMSAAGERLSIYTTPPATTTPPPLDTLSDAPAVVLDLAPWTREIAVGLTRDDLPIWTDLHDVPPDSAWHEPFWRAATVVQCSEDKLPEPLAFLHRIVDDGVTLAICTLGARGAVAVDRLHREHVQLPVPCDVVDTNGAGDAFFAGVMASMLTCDDVPAALFAGARQASRALGTRDIGPGLRWTS